MTIRRSRKHEGGLGLDAFTFARLEKELRVWLAVVLIEVEKNFRKLRGHAGMSKLVAALRAHDAKLKPPVVDAMEKAA